MRFLLPLLASLLIAASSAFVQPATLNLASARQSRGTFSSTPYSHNDPSRLSAHGALPTTGAAADIFSLASSSAPSTVTVSAATVDPTSLLSSVLGGLLGSPAILLIPVLAAVAVATVVAAFIVWSANPADEDED